MVINATQETDFRFYVTNEIRLAASKPFIVKKKKYIPLFMGFDIETTKTSTDHSYMWCWSYSLKLEGCETITIIGRTWDLFETLIRCINERLKICRSRALVGVANLGFEFQFICRRFEITDFFAMERRRPVKFSIDRLEFFDVLLISGRNLDHLAKNYTQTKKLVGDLDYTEQRNSLTPFKDNEKQYVINDTVIVSEYLEFLYKKYWITGFIPLTKTGILRNEIKAAIPKEWKKKIFRTYLKSRQQYEYFFKHLFRGGFTHANALYTGLLLENVNGADFTSSYPYVMLSEKFPMSEPREIEPDKWLDYMESEHLQACAVLRFVNICAKTTHSVESEHKCIHVENPIVDNGRIAKADEMVVFLTELDYKIYKMFYEWDEVECWKCYAFKSDYLPKWFTDVIKKYYTQKNQLKKAGLSRTAEYSVAKEMVNSSYGLTVTRLNFTEYKWNGETWTEESTSKPYKQLIAKENLNPMWGIYVTAYARYNLLSVVAELGKDAIYCDTDSVYFKDSKKNRKIIEKYNKAVDLKEKCKEWKGTDLEGLGKFDPLGIAVKFKTLGAKRYLKQLEDGTIEQTVAGIPKGLLVKYCEKRGLDPFEYFQRDMYVPEVFDDIQNKLRSKYDDTDTCEEVIDAYGNSEIMSEKSSITLIPVDFTMTMSEFYMQLVHEIQSVRKGRKR